MLTSAEATTQSYKEIQTNQNQLKLKTALKLYGTLKAEGSTPTKFQGHCLWKQGGGKKEKQIFNIAGQQGNTSFKINKQHWYSFQAANAAILDGEINELTTDAPHISLNTSLFLLAVFW